MGSALHFIRYCFITGPKGHCASLSRAMILWFWCWEQGVCEICRDGDWLHPCSRVEQLKYMREVYLPVQRARGKVIEVEMGKGDCVNKGQRNGLTPLCETSI